MKGAIGFLVGIIGLCVFASVTLLIPMIVAPRRSEGLLVVLILLIADFVFLNVLVVSFLRMLGHLHETVVYPDDPRYQPLRGRVLFFIGYIGLLVVLVLAVLVPVLSGLLRMRIGPGDEQVFIAIAWVAGWVFSGCLLGGVLMMLNDVFHKAFFRTMIGSPGDRDDDLDVSHRGARRPSRRDTDEDRARRWDEE